MKEQILPCRFCGGETRHLNTKKIATTKTGYRIKRTVQHCTRCNNRTVNNMNRALNKGTYVKHYPDASEKNRKAK